MRHKLYFTTFLAVLFVLLSAASLLLSAQTTVTEENLLRLIGSKAPETLIIKAISMAKSIDVDTSLEGTVALMGKGVSEKVVKALVEKKEQLDYSSTSTSPSTSPSSIGEADRAAPMVGTIPTETGMFVETSTGLTPLPLETVSSRKSPGAFQAMRMGASLGFSRMKMSSSLSGTRSSMQLSGSITVVLRCMDGISADDYKLVALEQNKKSESREFVTNSAGLRGSSSDENAIPAAFQKIGPNVYKTTLADLKDGEYGFLIMGQKLYTFGKY